MGRYARTYNQYSGTDQDGDIFFHTIHESGRLGPHQNDTLPLGSLDAKSLRLTESSIGAFP